MGLGIEMVHSSKFSGQRCPPLNTPPSPAPSVETADSEHHSRGLLFCDDLDMCVTDQGFLFHVKKLSSGYSLGLWADMAC